MKTIENKIKQLQQLQDLQSKVENDLQAALKPLYDFIGAYENANGSKAEKAVVKQYVSLAKLAIKYGSGNGRKGGND